MDQDKRTLDFLRLFVRHQQEIYAYILTCSGRADYSWILLGDPFPGPTATVSAEGARDLDCWKFD